MIVATLNIARHTRISASILSLMAWSLLLCTLIFAQAQANDTTDFFENHPNEIDAAERGDNVLFANRQTGIEFKRVANGFQLTRVYDIKQGHDFLTQTKTNEFQDLFQIRMTLDPHKVQKDERGTTKYGHFNILDQMAGDDPFIIGSNEAKEVSWRHEDHGEESVLHLEWRKIDAREDKGVMDVEVTVRLRAGDPLSYWRINVLNRSIYGTGNRHYPRHTRYGIERVRFPLLNLAPIEDANNNIFLYPKYRGELFQKPFRDGYNTEAFYPHNFNMQFQALYNQKTASGLYLGTQDPAASFMVYEIRHRNSYIKWQLGHFPPNITFTGEDFDLPYDCVIGPFQGDWYDACQIYRQWAIQQPWCRKGKLFQRQDIPDWYKHTPLYFYTDLGDSAEGTHSQHENMRIAADHFSEFLEWADMQLPANWYEWTEEPEGLTGNDIPMSLYRRPRPGRWAGFSSSNSHGGNYPKIPALTGLSAVCKHLREIGGMVCPYFALELFDVGPSFNAPYASESIPHLVRDLYGAMRRWGAQASLQPCVVTSWWRNRSKETCVLMLQNENVSGVYLDVMQGCQLPCYWTPHGHTAAGGDSMTRGMRDLVQIITDAVKTKDPEAITTGENPSENMIDVTDGFLQVSLYPQNTAPIFATVYQDYILRYGLELSTSDRFFVECASMFSEGMQIGRLRLRPRGSALSFQNPSHKGRLSFLKLIVDYYKQHRSRKFLAYGQLLRPLTFTEPAPMPILTYASADKKSTSQFPALMSGVFRDEDSALGIFVANASGKNLAFSADLELSQYGFPDGAIAQVHQIDPDGTSEPISGQTKNVLTLSDTLPARHITMFYIKQDSQR